MQGNNDVKYRDGEDDYNINVEFDKFDRSKISESNDAGTEDYGSEVPF